MTGTPQPSKRKNRAIRFTLSYKGKDVRLVSAKRIEMLAMTSDPLKSEGKRSGFWFELRDAEDRPLYRLGAWNPIQFSVEVPSEDPKRPFVWVKVPAPEGKFTLLAPDIEKARSLVLFSSPLGVSSALARAEEIARFPLPQGTGREVTP
jgi:hypothetical protein